VWTAPTSSARAIGATCADVLFIGARGSGEELTDVDGRLVEDGYGRVVRILRDGAEGAYVGAGTVRQYTLDYSAVAIGSLATDFAASIASFARLHGPVVSAFLESADSGAAKLRAILEDSHQRCPKERWVLAGYSQGALTIHSALIGLDAPEQLAAAVLVADPARDSTNADAAPSVFHGSPVIGGQGVVSLAHESGVLAMTAPLDIYEELGAMPQGVRSKVIEVCNEGDVVCDTSRTLPVADLLVNPAAWSEDLVSRAYKVHGHYGTDDASASGISESVLAGYGGDAVNRILAPLTQQRLHRQTHLEVLDERLQRIATRERRYGV